MSDWMKKLHDILTINDREILMDAGRISRALAEDIANKEFEKFKEKKQLKDEADPSPSNRDASTVLQLNQVIKNLNSNEK